MIKEVSLVSAGTFFLSLAVALAKEKEYVMSIIFALIGIACLAIGVWLVEEESKKINLKKIIASLEKRTFERKKK